MQQLSITWFGHATFILKTPGGKRVLLDPWLTDNPSCPEAMKKPPQADLILVSHGHWDHIGDLISSARASGAPVVGILELCSWLEQKGISNTVHMNKGGTVDLMGLQITMVDARHSAGYVDHGVMINMGEAAGFIVKLENGMTIYFAGDTALFGDMKLIGEMYKPDIAILPIGDRFTMGPEAAAKACTFLGIRKVLPMHWGTFPLLTGRPEQFRALVEPKGIEILELKPGETLQAG